MNKEYEEQAIEQEYADVVSRLSAYKRSVHPGEEVLQSALSRVPDTDERVMLGEALRYAGSVRSNSSIISVISDYFSMQNNWKMIAPVAVVVLLVGVAVVGMKGDKGVDTGPLATERQASMPVAEDSAAPQAKMMAAENIMPVPEGSGNIDDIVAELSTETDADAAMLADTDADRDLVMSDSQVISEYGNTYDETAF